MVDNGKWMKESLVWPVVVEKVDSFSLRPTLQVWWALFFHLFH
jgi:hypothetical protein